VLKVSNDVQDYHKSLKNFLTEKKWFETKCSFCGRIFYQKNSVSHRLSCGWKEKNEKQPFANLSKRKRIKNPKQIHDIILQSFDSLGFKKTLPLNIAYSKGKTDLIIAGVQIFDEVIHCNEKSKNEKIFIVQPCIRMQFQKLINSEEGISTSFINICTEVTNIEFKEHLKIIDHWCDVFSTLGLHMNEFSIVIEENFEDWGTGKFPIFKIFFIYNNVELGDASYFFIPKKNKEVVIISDIGFGLERIVWAVNRTNSYFDMISPWTVVCNKELLDITRTLSLLALCGVIPSNNGPGLQFRRLSKILSEKYYRQEIFLIVSYYFDYWANFIKPSVNRDLAILSVRLEVERFINLKISKELNTPVPRKETTEDYLNRLIFNFNNVNTVDFKKTIKKCIK